MRLAFILGVFTMTQANQETAQPSRPASRVWDVHQVSELLGCSARHIFRMADDGLMPWGFKFGALRRWNAEEIERWIADGGKPCEREG